MSRSSAFFKTVPEKDHLHLFDENRPNVKKVVDFLNYRKEDVAAATGLPKDAIRYDIKMPRELEERAQEWATALNLVGGFFKDEQKTLLWFSTSNPLLGEIAPRDMIRLGRFKKLLKFIQTALTENSR